MRPVYRRTPGDWLVDLACVLGMIALAIVCVLVIAACAPIPKDFKPGAKVEPPQGCIDQRKRNPNAEC